MRYASAKGVFNGSMPFWLERTMKGFASAYFVDLSYLFCFLVRYERRVSSFCVNRTSKRKSLFYQ